MTQRGNDGFRKFWEEQGCLGPKKHGEIETILDGIIEDHPELKDDLVKIKDMVENSIYKMLGPARRPIIDIAETIRYKYAKMEADELEDMIGEELKSGRAKTEGEARNIAYARDGQRNPVSKQITDFLRIIYGITSREPWFYMGPDETDDHYELFYKKFPWVVRPPPKKKGDKTEDGCLDAHRVPLIADDNDAIGVYAPDPARLHGNTYTMKRDRFNAKCDCENCQQIVVSFHDSFLNSPHTSLKIICGCCCKACRPYRSHYTATSDGDCSKCEKIHKSEDCSHTAVFGNAYLIGPKWKGIHSDWDDIAA